MSKQSNALAMHPPLPKDVPLFRPEITIGLANQGMGGIRLRSSGMSYFLTGVAIMLVVALISFLRFGTVSSKAKVAGVVVPTAGSVTIDAQDAGILRSVKVREGDVVRRGQVLFELDLERAGVSGELGDLRARQISLRRTTLESEREAKEEQRGQRLKALQQRVVELTAQAGQMDADVAAASRHLEITERSLKKFSALESAGFVSPTQIETKQIEVLEQNAKISSLARSKQELLNNLRAARDEIAIYKTEFRASQAQLERSFAALDQEALENQSRRQLFVRAPSDGVVATITSVPGQAVAGSSALATFIPANADASAGELEVNLYAPSRTAGFVEPGQKVLLRYQAFPYEKYGLKAGTVTDVSRTPLSPGELPPHLANTILSNAQAAASVRGNESLYRIRVKIVEQVVTADGHVQTIRPGMTLDADIIQSERKVWEWIVEPLLALR